MDVAGNKSIRCALWAREQGVPAIGTAGSYRGFLVLEWPLPWPSDPAAVPELAPLVLALRDTGVRLQLVVPRTADAADRLVLFYNAADAAQVGFAGYACAHRVTTSRSIVDDAIELLAGGPSDQPLRTQADVLICTHGKRDLCCGSYGTTLALQAVESNVSGDHSVQVWRTSHLGGHRFAPTVLTLPSGGSWADVGLDSLARIIAGTPSADDIATRYRGCTAFGSPALQVLERSVMMEMGGDPGRTTRVARMLDSTTAQLVVHDSRGSASTWTAAVEAVGSVAVPPCGEPYSDSAKREVVYAVGTLLRS